GLGPAAGNASAFGSTTSSACVPSGSGSIACLCMRTFGGGAKARRGPLSVTASPIRAATGVPTWGPERSTTATFGASCSCATGGGSGAFTDGTRNGRTTFGFTAPIRAATGVPTWGPERSATATFGASCSGATGGGSGSFTDGTRNGRTTFGVTAGSGSAGFRSAAVTFGASCSGTTGGTTGAFTAGARNGRTTFGV